MDNRDLLEVRSTRGKPSAPCPPALADAMREQLTRNTARPSIVYGWVGYGPPMIVVADLPPDLLGLSAVASPIWSMVL